MASITFAVDDKLKDEISKFVWINLSELVKQELLRRQELLNRFNSKEEQELIKWSVDLGRRSKKDRFKELLKEISPETRDKLLSKLTPKKRDELLR
jgi:flagellar basal body-associated protein FliL